MGMTCARGFTWAQRAGLWTRHLAGESRRSIARPAQSLDQSPARERRDAKRVKVVVPATAGRARLTARHLLFDADPRKSVRRLGDPSAPAALQ